MRVLLAAAVLALAALLLVARTDGEGVAIREWTFTGPDGASAPVVLPTHVNDRLPSDVRATYTLTRHLALAPSLRERDLVLVLPYLVAHTRLRVDGVIARPLTEDDENAGYRAKGPHAWRIPAAWTARGALDLSLEVDRNWTQSGWLDTVPRLTTSADGGARFVFQRALAAVTDYGALALALFVGYLYLNVYLADRRRSTYLWFALTGLSGFLYPLFQTAITAPFVGPFEVTLAVLGVASSVITQIHFTHAHFGLPRPARAWDVAWVLVALTSIVSTSYFHGTQIGGTCAVLLAIPATLWQVGSFVRLHRRTPRPPDLYLVLGGWVLLPVLGVPDFAAWLGLGEWLGGLRTADLDIAFIAILQTTAMSREHTQSLRRADELAEERKRRIAELEVLNDELRRQIEARSRDLGDAITRLGDSAGERELLVGEVIEDRYQVVRKLGSGAAGSVYLVTRRTDGTELAMKVVRGVHDRTALVRLAREAQVEATVNHENVVSVIDVDIAGSGFLFIVMEYVAGDTLREHRAEYGHLAWAIDVLRQIASGLAAVHERGIVHRDLKPANILMVPRGSGATPLAKIADFGIAALVDDPADGVATVRSTRPATLLREVVRTPPNLQVTETGVLLGTPLYMAPETIDGAKNAAQSVDVFSFGVIAYELLTTALPFLESPALAQLQGVSVAAPQPTALRRPDVPRAVADLVDRCLSFDPAERPTSHEAREVLRHAT